MNNEFFLDTIEFIKSKYYKTIFKMTLTSFKALMLILTSS